MRSCKKLAPMNIGKYYLWILKDETAQLSSFALRIQKDYRYLLKLIFFTRLHTILF